MSGTKTQFKGEHFIYDNTKYFRSLCEHPETARKLHCEVFYPTTESILCFVEKTNKIKNKNEFLTKFLINKEDSKVTPSVDKGILYLDFQVFPATLCL